MLEHTPGPWLHQSRDRGGIGSIISQVSEQQVANCSPYALGGDQALAIEQAEANARLIAAAPDMLALLERLEDTLAFDGSTLLYDVRDAIAKATAQ